jgi:CheY-like chemotaxis protein
MDLRHHLREISQIIKQTFPKSIVLELRIADNLWPIYGDPTQMHQVLLNLCVNARDAMPDGGTLSIDVENVTLDEFDAKAFNAPNSGRYVVLTVSDTGTGMSPDIIDKIFDPFFTTKALGQGTGLGLSTVLGIVKGHSGFIQVDSRLGTGSVFHTYWPASKPIIPKPDDLNNFKAADRIGTSILIVDDEKSIRQTMSMFLKAKGYQVFAAQDGKEALQLLDGNPDVIRIVIVDIWMPFKDGFNVIQEIENRYPKTSIIATSGMAEMESKASTVSSAVKAFLRKPWIPSQLLEIINTVSKEINRRV